jgi:CheY-like chemotaxis protein
MTQSARRVLVVDDNAINLEVAVELLRQFGVQTDSANDGAQAVALALGRAYDLIVMDVQMPGMDGIEATRRIRRASGPLPPIIALTAHADADDHSTCLAAGMNGYLSKPVQPELLLSVLQGCWPGWTAAPASPLLAPALAATPAHNEADEAAVQRYRHLTAIAGLDVPGSLQNVGGQMPRLERVLQRFATTYRDGDPALLTAACQGDTAALWQACHSLRGACAVLCATALVQRIEALEAALDARQPSAGWLDAVLGLQTELIDLAGQLAAVFAPP